MTEDNDEETPDEGFSEDEKRQIKIHAEGSYQALARIEEEKLQEKYEVPVEPRRPEETLYDERLHWVAVFPAFATLWLLPLILIFLLVICWSAQQTVISMDNGMGLARYIFPDVPLVATVVVAVVIIKNNWRLIFRAIVIYKTSRLIITDRRVLYVVKVKGWILNLISSVDDINATLQRETINDANVEQSGIAEVFGYATIRLLSQADHDKRFRMMRYLRKPKLLREIFDVEQPQTPQRKLRIKN